eukprot:Em0007g1226a
MGRLAVINTPLRWQVWERINRSHPDEQFAEYVVSSLRDGFWIGFSYPRPCRSSIDNMHSAREHAQVVRDYLSNECAEGRIVGPLPLPGSKEIHVSRFGVTPKGSSGKWRLIFDLSSPEGASVNDGIDSNLCSLKYATIDQAAELMLRLGRGALMAKVDIDQAYHRISVHPDDRWLLGMCFEGVTYMDTVLPFGLRDLRSLVGKLENACKVVRPGRSFLRRMIDLLRGVKSNRRLIRLNSSFRSDLLWWHHFLSGWNGVSAAVSLELVQPDVVVHSNASGSIGCAAWWSEGWLHYEWPPEVAAASITPKETLPVVFACAVWGQLWGNKRIRFYCDNEAAVANLNSGRSKEPWSMHMIRYPEPAAIRSQHRCSISERTLSLFLAYLYTKGLSGNTAKTYLAGIRYTQIAMGLADPKISEMQQLEYITKGFRSYGDVKIDAIRNPSYIEVTIKASKTDPFRKGVKVYLGVTGVTLCPVASILSYMVSRGSRTGPFFSFSDQRPLTRDRLVKEVCQAMRTSGIDDKLYSGHSFRIGAATTAASCGLQDSLIKTLGRWESAAYTIYIRTPKAELCGVASKLVTAARQ